MHAALFYAQLPSKWTIIYQNRPSTRGVIKFVNLHPAQYKISEKRDFLKTSDRSHIVLSNHKFASTKLNENWHTWTTDIGKLTYKEWAQNYKR